MTTQIVAGMLKTNVGYIPLESTITDDTDNQEVKTDSTYTVTSQSIGTFADGQTLQAGFVNAKTNIFYAYILRNGTNVCNIMSIASRTCAGNQKLMGVSNPIQLRPGDQLVVRTIA
tara:strand:+ start:234 stop:581 length:348 start_codon:yes stop_codon:yes gene_type:complete